MGERGMWLLECRLEGWKGEDRSREVMEDYHQILMKRGIIMSRYNTLICIKTTNTKVIINIKVPINTQHRFSLQILANISLPARLPSTLTQPIKHIREISILIQQTSPITRTPICSLVLQSPIPMPTAETFIEYD